MTNTKRKTFKIAVTGPESSGKSSLATALSNRLAAPCVPEFARYFVSHLGRPYLHTDLEAIGRGQFAWEQWFLALSPAVLVCDTDWTVLHVWEQYRFGYPATGDRLWQKGYTDPKPADLYLLCAPDFPWHHDPLREHPEERGILFDHYQQLLQETRAPYAILTGDHHKRLEIALSLVQKLS